MKTEGAEAGNYFHIKIIVITFAALKFINSIF
jgi:hypothetical protein